MLQPDNVEVTDTSSVARENLERRAKWLVLLIGFFVVGGLLTLPFRDASTAVRSSGTDTSSDTFDVSIPSSKLTPEEVVTLQMRSMQASLTDGGQLVTCYSLASPSNREVTGPFERFRLLLSSEPYVQLIRCKNFEVGSPLIEGNFAAVLVTLLSDQNLPLAFSFVLGKQQLEPYTDCWMTESVVPVVLQPMMTGPDLKRAAAGD